MAKYIHMYGASSKQLAFYAHRTGMCTYVRRCTHVHTCVHMEETMKFLNAVHAQDAIMGSCVCTYVHRICERKRVPTSSPHLLAPPHPTSLSSPGAGDVPRWP